MNENIAFKERKLKQSGLVRAWFTTDGIIRIKKTWKIAWAIPYF